MFEIPAALLSWFYGLTASYTIAIGLMALVVIAITTPLTVKSSKGLLAMQRLEPELRRLQAEHHNDRVTLDEEMRKLFREHKINPAVPYLPMLAQAAVFVVMFGVLRGLTYAPRGSARPISDAVWAAFGRPDQITDPGFIPRFLSVESPLYESLFAEREMMSLGIDLARSAAEELVDGVVGAWPYLLLVVGLGALYFILQRTVVERDSIRPTMSPGQHKLLGYLPIVFAVIQLFFLAALVLYYIAQTFLRIVQQRYITRSLFSKV
jgi:YidC/Oxa1 family membrane protein insertase